MARTASRRDDPEVREPKLGKREENKLRKLAKIAKAAKQVLSKKGFEAATMQDIAKVAGVGIGTLFLYADNKRDLAFLAAAEDFAITLGEARKVPTTEPFVDQVVDCVHQNFVLHHKNPEMAKIILTEFLFFTGKQARQYGGGIVAMKEETTRRVQLCQARGELVNTVPAAEIADITYYLFQGVVRRWVQGGAIHVGEGLAAYHRALTLTLTGLMVRSAN
ncbi:TetR/AcrR family transcriptional regulator [Devosia sp. A449]